MPDSATNPAEGTATQGADRGPVRTRLGEALDDYFYGEFASVGAMLGWFALWRPEGRLWGLALSLAVLSAATGWRLDRADDSGVPEIVAVLLSLHGLPAVHALVFGFVVAWWYLRTFGPHLRASLDHRVRMRLATLIARREVRFPSGDSTRAAWTAWRNDLESLSRRGASPRIGTGVWTLISTTVGTASGATWLALSRDEVGPILVSALLIGLPLIVASFLMGRANRQLYERTLQCVLKGLAESPCEANHLGEYPSSIWIDVPGAIGVLLVTPALVAAVLALLP